METSHRTRSQQRRRLVLLGVAAFAALIIWPLPVLLLTMAAGGVFAAISGWQELRARGLAGRRLRGTEPIGPAEPSWAQHAAVAPSGPLQRAVRPDPRKRVARGHPTSRRPAAARRPSARRPTSVG